MSPTNICKVFCDFEHVNYMKGKLFFLTISFGLGVFIEAPCGAALSSILQLGISLWKVLWGLCIHTENSSIVIHGPTSKIIPAAFLYLKYLWVCFFSCGVCFLGVFFC